MSLFNALSPLLNAKTAKVALEVSAHPSKEQHMVVVARPVMGPVPANACEELKQLCAALATPVKVIGTADEIETTLREVIGQQQDHRQDWAARVASLEAMIAQGQEKDAKGQSSAKAKSKPASETQKTQTSSPKAPEPSKTVAGAEHAQAAAKAQDEIGFSL